MASEVVCVILTDLCLGKPKKKRLWAFFCFTVSTSKHQQHRSSFSSSWLQVKSALCSYWSTSPNTSGKAKILWHSFFCQDVVRRPRCGVGCRPLWFPTQDKKSNHRTRRPFLVLTPLVCRFVLLSDWYCAVWTQHEAGRHQIFNISCYRRTSQDISAAASFCNLSLVYCPTL